VKKSYIYSCLAIGTLLFAGCASMPEKYIPTTMGPVSDGETVKGLQLTIVPSSETISIGDELTMKVTIKNLNTTPVWFPRNPEIMILWTYPDGHRDNMVFEFTNERYYTKDQVVLLKPNEAVQTHMKIKTYYFPKAGITEFQAFCNSAGNTNPDINPFWQGRIFSNTYGVKVEKGKSS
jgi:hypothetical protein